MRRVTAHLGLIALFGFPILWDALGFFWAWLILMALAVVNAYWELTPPPASNASPSSPASEGSDP